MKIAIVTEDGATISQHFGRARYYAVLTVENQQVVGREMLDRTGAILPPDEHHEPRQGVTGQVDCHGTGLAAAAHHERMIQPIKGCQVLLTRGLGWSGRLSLVDAHIRPIITDMVDIDAAVKTYLDGSIVDHVELLH